MSADDGARLPGDDTDDWLENTEADTSPPFFSIPVPERDPRNRKKASRLEYEIPLRHELALEPADFIDCHLGLTLSSPQQRDALLCILGNLVAASARSNNTWVFYSRDRNHFAQLRKARRYLPNWYSYRTVLTVIDSLEKAGLIFHRRTNSSPSAKYRSRLKATPRLLASLVAAGFRIVHQQSELVVLRDADRTPIDYRETRQTDAMRREIAAQNAFLSNFDITVEHSDVFPVSTHGTV